MQRLEEQSEAYFNFINSIDSNRTRQSYEICMLKFLDHYRTDLGSLLKLSPQDITNLMIKYLVDRKISNPIRIKYYLPSNMLAK